MPMTLEEAVAKIREDDSELYVPEYPPGEVVRFVSIALHDFSKLGEYGKRHVPRWVAWLRESGILPLNPSSNR